MYRKPALDLADSRIALEAALAVAGRNGWSVCIAIVDDAGTPVQLARMDGAGPASVDGAIGKARSAAVIGVETRLLEAMLADRPALAALPRLAVEGGVPLHFEGMRVGGIGVSGVQSGQDAEVARAGQAALITHWAG